MINIFICIQTMSEICKKIKSEINGYLARKNQLRPNTGGKIDQYFEENIIMCEIMLCSYDGEKHPNNNFIKFYMVIGVEISIAETFEEIMRNLADIPFNPAPYRKYAYVENNRIMVFPTEFLTYEPYMPKIVRDYMGKYIPRKK